MSLHAFAALPLLASLVLAYRADPGTVYVAADSRLTPATPSTTTSVSNETTCKIRVLRDGIVFVGTGNALFSTDGVTTSIYAAAAHAAATLPSGPLQSADVRRIAYAWQSEVLTRLIAKQQAQSAGVTSSELAGATGITGSFYAATSNREVIGITLRIAPDAAGLLAASEEPQPSAGYLTATGTAAAKRDSLALAASPQNAKLPWPQRLQAIESQTIRIETRRYGRQTEIGGPIDLIQITADGPRWLARKPTCR